MTTPEVAIIGGGLGGPLLARVLQRRGFSATIYESETGMSTRLQGATLDLHAQSGQLALKEAGLYGEFLKHVHPNGEVRRIFDKTGKLYDVFEGLDLPERSEESGRPEIDREDLRNLLVRSLEPGTLCWGKKLAGITPLGDGRHTLSFTDGSKTTADLVVGADGTRSKVRPLLTPVKPEYSGISFLEMYLSNVDEAHPESAALVGSGTMVALSDNKGIIAHRMGHARICAYVALRVPEDWLKTTGVDWADTEAAKGSLLESFSDWDEAFKTLIKNADAPITPRPIYALPTGHNWTRVPGVTLIGDAAHVMSPFAGEGANLALQDGLELAQALTKHEGDIEAALTHYETALFPRSAQAAEESAVGLEASFNANTPYTFVNLFRSFFEPKVSETPYSA